LGAVFCCLCHCLVVANQNNLFSNYCIFMHDNALFAFKHSTLLWWMHMVVSILLLDVYHLILWLLIYFSWNPNGHYSDEHYSDGNLFAASKTEQNMQYSYSLVTKKKLKSLKNLFSLVEKNQRATKIRWSIRTNLLKKNVQNRILNVRAVFLYLSC